MIFTLATRDSEGISVIHDRNPMVCAAVRWLDPQRLHHPHRQQAAQVARLILSVDGIPSTLIDYVGLPPRADGRQLITVGPDQTKEVRVMATDYSATPPAPSTTVLFTLTDIDPAPPRRCAITSSDLERGCPCPTNENRVN